MNWDRTLPRLLGGLVLLAAGVAIAFATAASSSLPEGPVDVVWDKAACAHCRMHVGEPAFAAQLTTTGGETLAFDDPGCLFEYLERAGPDVHAIWFHHFREDRWVAASDAVFVEASPTPMGYGIAAVDRGAPGAADFDAARARCTEQRR